MSNVRDVKTFLDGFSVTKKMTQANEELLNNLILFLTMCPKGLNLDEIQLVLESLPSTLTDQKRREKINLYMQKI